MRKTILILLLTASLCPAVYSSALLKPLEPGRIAVYICPTENKPPGKLYPDNFDNCLKNHLDYFLWERGQDFEFLPATKKNKPDNLIKDLSADKFRYLYYITPECEFKLKKISLSPNDSQKTEKPTILLNLKFHTRLYDLRNDSLLFELKDYARSQEFWIKDTSQTEIASPAEPPDFVLMNLISRLPLPPFSARPGPSDSQPSLPLHLVFDSRIFNDISQGGDSVLLTSIDYASRSLFRQFGVGLKIATKDFFTVREVSFDDITNLFQSFLKTYGGHSDTLTLGIFRPNNPEDFYRRNENIQIGSSDLGRKTSLVAELDMPGSSTSEWRVLLNGQLILHEIGHLLGAIHVSDISSIMTRKTNWVASDSFDTLNASIIREGLQDSEKLKNIKEYLTSLALALENAGYYQADYPSTYFSYLNVNSKSLREQGFGGSPFAQSLLYAAEGYKQYLIKNSKNASEMFHLALPGAADQGSIHYYLSKVTSGKESERQLKTASEAGYLDAIIEMPSLWK